MNDNDYYDGEISWDYKDIKIKDFTKDYFVIKRIYNTPFPPKSDFNLLLDNIDYMDMYEMAYDKYMKKGYYNIREKATVKQQQQYDEEENNQDA